MLINRKNLKNVLENLNFINNDNVYTKRFSTFDVLLSVDFNNEKLIYPKCIKGYNKNTDFDIPENFVMFECVNRLLEKGYRPEHIELQRRWQLGHNSKGGIADICVKNLDGDTILCIIECKTWGDEYRKEKDKMKIKGGQLFSYWQQENSTKWLILYTSNYSNNSVVYKNLTIDCSDDKNIVKLAQSDNSIKLYQDAHSAKAKYFAWRDTYQLKISRDVIFSLDSSAYKTEQKPLQKKDLISFSSEDRIVNQFEEILRHNNVSDRENAFNKLIALFIAKLVDEITKTDDMEVEFQYKIGTDSYESLQDRLQKLHHEGMQKFMEEKVAYIPNDYPENLFRDYNSSYRKKAIDDLKNTIRILKFYSNNDFAFKDVHNEELFYQNGKILVEMVQLFEKYKIIYSSKQQFLGDLFEQLLNKGFKQNEGQFFTPTPITRFIWDSLPTAEYMLQFDNQKFPKIIDYACGAGHFLTEGIEAVNYFLNDTDNNSWARDSLFGIEKDYRLARTAKISLFMNGAGLGNIIFGDGLENYENKGIEENTFDILVANPPYSVKDFTQHLDIRNNTFKVLEKIRTNGNEIETLFVERIHQLLRPKGLAAVILPASILSNDSASYIEARKQIFQNFYVRGIVSLPNITFSATGIKTIILFLEKFPEPPTKKETTKDIVSGIFQHKYESDSWIDNEILISYLETIQVSIDFYSKFILYQLTKQDFKESSYFMNYYKNLSPSNFKKFYDRIINIEKSKLYYYALLYKNNTVIVNSPTNVSESKRFLGYSWSKRKGSEGIVINTAGGALYNNDIREDDNTIAGFLRQSFTSNKTINTPNSSFSKYIKSVSSTQLLDFVAYPFNAAIKTSNRLKYSFSTQYPLCSLSDLFETIEIGKRPKGGVDKYSSGVFSLGGEHIDNNSGYLNLTNPKYVTHNYFKSAKRGKVHKNDILICKDGARTGKVALVRNEFVSEPALINEHIFLLRTTDPDTQNFLFHLLFSRYGQGLLKSYVSGSAQGGLNLTNLKNITLPKPPSQVIQKICTDFKPLDETYRKTRMSINSYQDQLCKIFDRYNISIKAK